MYYTLHTSLIIMYFNTVINGEKAAYCTPTFSEKRNRTLSLLLKDVEHKCTNEVFIPMVLHVYTQLLSCSV